MPHINRIRVNNVKYNFGTQFYDDFMMRFSCKNTIYDLANGGGKSVLMLLLFQNLIPNCTLDEKQPIEKLFRKNEGSTTIHSLIEWKLSDEFIKDNFKYMLTGFCARKAKDNSETDLNGEIKKNGQAIEYFNYVIFYRKFNDNDIKNLNESFNNIMKSIEQLNEKNENILMAQKESKDLYQKINISSGEKKSPSSNLKQYKMKNKPQKNIVKKNYRVITPLDEDSAGENKRYKSHTYDRRNQLTSHSVNSLNIRPKNYIENNIEYQIDAKSNSKSKGNNDEENSNGSKRINSKYRFKKYSYSNLNINPYTNGINDSYILQEEDFAFIDNRLRELYPNNDISYNLVYRATEDGDKASDFHQRCDKIGPNITLVKTRNGYIFGGFTMKNWEHLKRDINENKPNLGSASRDVRAFGFSVNYQKIYNNERKNEFAI